MIYDAPSDLYFKDVVDTLAYPGRLAGCHQQAVVPDRFRLHPGGGASGDHAPGHQREDFGPSAGPVRADSAGSLPPPGCCDPGCHAAGWAVPAEDAGVTGG